MQKLISLGTILQLKNDFIKVGKKIAWTNGCFDFMHAGHVDYLERAKNYGILVVGLNNDQSVKRYKGDMRPICNEMFRAQVLNALTCVDYIIIFKDKTPIKLIEKIEPDIAIIDAYLPDSAGEDFIWAIAKKCPKTPIVVISGSNPEQNVTKLLDSGRGAFLLKPFKLLELDETIQNLLEKKMKSPRWN